MKYYKDKDGKVFAYEADGSQDALIPASYKKMTNAEVTKHLNPPTDDVVPTVVSRFQARRALKDVGKFEAVEAAIAQADEFTKDAWNDAQEFRRDSGLIQSLGSSLSLDLDALFIAAAKIEA